MAIKELKFKARYTKIDEIEVILPLNELDDEKRFTLVQDGIAIAVLTIKERLTVNNRAVFLLSTDKIMLGHRYHIADETYQKTILSMRMVPDFPSFDGEYTYLENDLGARYAKEHTTFVLWAPLCSQVNLVLKDRKYHMEREDKGIYRYDVQGDYDGAIYYYEVIIDDEMTRVTDPYASGSTLNSRASVVINPEKTAINLHNDEPVKLARYTDAIIYELSVRDFSSFARTNIENKGTFLGAIEEGRTNEYGDAVGFDYLKTLGITHVQLMPIFDFFTVDEENPPLIYNWGYDPRQFNVVEGSLASDRNDPYGRILELKKMVAAFHLQGLKVNMDVVYNHVYAYEYSVFETIVPNYFFRKKLNGDLSNGSFCGNDFDSTRPMAQKFILDSLRFWMQEYGIDGFRFDLMAIIDIKTSEKIVALTRSIKSDCMIYGEGWNMPTALIDEKKTSINNALRLKDIAFFNDLFRDVLKGKTMDDDATDRGYLLGNAYLRGAFKYAFLGSAKHTSRLNMFISPNQSINYVECHDNATLFDKVKACYEDKSTAEVLAKVKFINAVNLFCRGVPFIHMGQEIGLSKNGHKNSYNAGDAVNQFNYGLIHSRKGMLKHFKDAIKIRKSLEILRCDDAKTDDNDLRFINLESGALLICIKNHASAFQELIIAINPSDKNVYYHLDDYYQVMFNEIGIPKEEVYVQSLSLNPENVMILIQK